MEAQIETSAKLALAIVAAVCDRPLPAILNHRRRSQTAATENETMNTSNMKNLNYSRMLAARLFTAGMLLATVGSASAAIRYVDVNRANPAPP